MEKPDVLLISSSDYVHILFFTMATVKGLSEAKRNPSPPYPD
jgi:hypothetical protein